MNDVKRLCIIAGLTAATITAMPARAQGPVGALTRTRSKATLDYPASTMAPGPAGARPAARSLYERLGGQPAITAVVDEFIANVVADARINHFFAKTDIPKLKGHLVDQICEASGGPCQYTGKPMIAAHAGMGISNGDFDALVEDLVRALDKFKVGTKEQSELLAVLGPMRQDIVEKK